jgi:gliding motility-associated-like protein
MTILKSKPSGPVLCRPMHKGPYKIVLVIVLFCIAPILSFGQSAGTIGANQCINSGATPAAFTSLTPENFPLGLFFTGYQWQYSSSSSGPFTTVPEHITEDEDFDEYAVTSPATATTYWRRAAIVFNVFIWAPEAYYSNVIVVGINPTVTPQTPLPVICEGAPTYSLGYTTTGGPNQYNILWNPTAQGAGFTNVNAAFSSNNLAATSGSLNVSVPGSATGSFNGTIAVRVSATGCSSSNIATGVTINPRPTATITPLGPTTFCAGGSVTLTASAGSSWAWSSGETTQSIVVSSTSSRTVTVTNSYGCSNTSSAQAVTVNPLPIATITAGGPITFCAGGSVTLTASAGSSWLWSNGATTQSITVNTTGNRTVEVTNANGCKNTSAAQSITVNPLPVATIAAGGPITFCAGGSVTLTASAGSSWLWSNGATTQSITVNTTGNRTVEVTDANGCKNTSAAQSITVNPLPVATITAGGPITFCADQSVTLTASAGSSWLWSNGATTQSITVNTSGNRTVEVTDANGCKNTSAARSITVNPLPVATITAGGPITFCAGGSVTLTASAGSSWLWSNGATTQSITVNTTGNRTVEVTNANGCKNTSSAQSITVNPLPVATITAGGPITFCADQSVTLTASAGSSWLWSNGATTQSITVNTTGNRTVEVTDANGCKNTSATQSITVNPLPVATITAGGPITFCADQSVTLTASAGSSWLWSNGATTQSITVNTSGNRTVEVTDANGCKSTSAAQSITVNPLPVATITAGGPITFCADQSVTLTASAGSSWLWSNGATTQSITVNTSGNRTVEVTDANGCKSTSAAQSITVNPLPVATITAGGPITFCADQSVTLTASAGSSWLWSNGATTQSITVNTSGNRTVEVTDANGCKSTSAAQSITVNPLPVATITAGGPITFCADQSVTLTASAGTSWLWSNGATTQSITVNTSGNRTVEVTDANGCKSTSAAQSITVNPLPVATITAGGPITFCADQSVTLTASAGSSWLWSNGATTQSITVNTTGNRTVEVTDANGCKNTSTAQSITVNPLPVATITAGGPITFCADQSVTLTASAGSSWLWSNGATTQSITVNTSGNRTVEVTDANGCKSTSATQSITVNPLPVATITAGGPITFCADQSVTLTASAGTSWLWSNGATTQSITVNTTGNRTVEVTDANGCKNTSSAQSITVNPLPVATITAGGPITFCADQSVTLTASAGSSWLWSNGATTQSITVNTTGNRTVEVTDANGCKNTSAAQSITVNPLPVATITAGGPITFCADQSVTLTASAGTSWLWSNGATTQSITVNTTGNRTVEVTDANGCKNTSAAQSITVNPLPVATITAGGPITFCADQSVTLTASAGSSWLWSNGATTQSITVNTTGNRTVEVTDANGCKNTSAAQSITVNPLPVATITAGGPVTFCADQSVTLTASAGTSWLWSNGATTQSITVNTTGNRTVEVTDANGCKNTSAAQSITVNPLPVATITAGGPITFCADQSVTLTASAGSSWLWSNGATTQSITVNTTGNRTVEVTDANGCKSTSAAQSITVNPLPVATITAGGPITFCADQSVTLTASAGSSWLWSNGATTQSITVNTTGNRTVEVTDANGCKSTSAAQSITVNPLPVATITAGGPITFCADQSVTLTASAGTSWLWSNGATTQSITVNTTGNRTVEVTDANGCKNTSTAQSITVNPLPVATITAGGPITFCADQSVTLTASAGSSWLWSNGATTQSITVNTTGNRTVEVTDANGCKNTSAAQSITVNPLPVATITAGGPITFCADQSVTLTASAGTSWLWSNGATTQSITVNTTGNRTVEVTDANGCKNTSTAQSITVNPLPVATITAGGPITFCADQSVTLTASAGSSWLWSNGATTQSITVNTTGNRTVEVTDANGCKNTSATQSITVNPLPVATITAGGPITFCADQSVTLTASAGSSWLWSNGATTQSITVNTTGNRTVEVTDGNGCKTTSSGQGITVNPLPTAAITAASATTFCAGGSVILTASAGTSWLWNTGETTQSITVNNTSNKTVIVKDGNGCENTSTAEPITVNSLPVATISAGSATTFCSGESVTLTASPGSSWLWSTGETTRSITVTGTSNNTVTVKDGNGCENSSAGTSITVNPLPVATITAATATTFCAGGSVLLTASPGSAWVWSSGETSQSITVNGTASKTVEVTDGNGCRNTSTVQTITVNPLPTPVITAGGATTFCAGGSVTLTASAGTAWLWSSGETTQSITVRGTDNKTVEVTDGNGCSNTSAITSITVNTLPTATITAGGPATFCAGESVTLTASAGTAWLWSSGETSRTITAITTDNKTVRVTDANGCQNVSTIQSVHVNPLPAATITAGGTTTFCAGGSVTLTASAGNSWLWSNGETTRSITVNNTANRSVQVTDANGCRNTSTVQAVTVNPLPVATISAGGPTAVCEGSTVLLTASAGSSWLWNSGETTRSVSVTATSGRSVTVTDANGCASTTPLVSVMVNPLPAVPVIAGTTAFCDGSSTTLSVSAAHRYLWNTGATTSSVSVNKADRFSVTVFDENGCSNTQSVQTTVYATPVLQISKPAAVCSPAAVDLTSPAVHGADVSLLSYFTDAAYTTALAEPSAVQHSGTYYLRATSLHGCTASGSVGVTVNASPVLTVHAPAAVCSPATIDLSAAAVSAGSTNGLKYSYWTNASATAAVDNAAALASGGTFYIKGTTAEGCSSVQAVQVTIHRQPVLSVTAPAAVCAPASINLTAAEITAGSQSGLQYSYWRDAAATSALPNPAEVISSNLYYIKATEPTTGCSITRSVQADVYSQPSVHINNPQPVCEPKAINLTEAIVAENSTPSLSYSFWADPDQTLALSDATVRASGTYYIKGTSPGGCSVTKPVKVTVNALPVGSLANPSEGVICEGSPVLLTAVSNASSFEWYKDEISVGTTTVATFEADASGKYTVQFKSKEGCVRTADHTVRLSLVRKPVLTFQFENRCEGQNTFFRNQSFFPKEDSVMWSWNFGDGSSSPAFAPSHKYAAAGTYTIALTLNTVSCPDLTKTIQIPITIEAPRQGIKYDTVRAVAGEDFVLTARSFGTQYRWLPPAGLDNAHAKITAGRLLKDGAYTVNITSDAGCVTTDSVWVKVGATAEIYVPQAFSPNGDGHNDRLHPNLVAIKKLNFFRIYNRWGNIIFQTSDASPQNGWNGKSGSTQQQTGTYTWVAEGVDAFGNTIRRSGTVLLVN